MAGTGRSHLNNGRYRQVYHDPRLSNGHEKPARGVVVVEHILVCQEEATGDEVLSGTDDQGPRPGGHQVVCNLDTTKNSGPIT